MKRSYILVIALFLLVLGSPSVLAQPWTYDFGTGTGSFTSSTASTSFLPAPTSGTARVRVGTNPGLFAMVNPGLSSLGSGSELQFTSNTGSASTSKFSVYDYTASKSGYMKFKIAFSGGTNGVYNLSIGDGANFSDNLAIGTAQVFAGLRWSFGASNAITYNVLNNTTYGTTGISNPTTLFTQDTSTIYTVEIYYNNTTSSADYYRSGTTYSVTNATWDLWVNGTRVGTGLAKGGLGTNVNIDSYAFNHQVSAATPGTLYLDDIEYSNALPALASEPTVQASAVNFSGIGTNGMTVNWTSGNGANRIVVMKAAGAVDGDPVDGTDYTANAAFGSGTQIGSGNYVVYAGSGSSVAVTGLAENTAYHVAVYEYNGSSPLKNYLTTSPATGNQTTNSAGVPAITISTTSLSDFGNVVNGSNSSEANYTVSGTSLTADIDVTAPTGFQVSTTSGSGFASSLSLTQTGGTVSNTTIYVRFAPGTASGAFSGNVTNASTGATTKNVAVTGNALDTEPTTQSSISFGTITASSIVVNMTGGNGEKRIVVARQASAVSFTPTDAAAASGVNADFSTATDQGSGNKIVYDGSGTSVTVTGLSEGVIYHFAVYEYNEGTGTSQNYNTASPGTGNTSTSGIVVSTASLSSFGNIVNGASSSEASYTVSGTGLSSDLVVTPPTGFEVSLTSGSGFTSSLNLTPSSGTVSTTTIYVRFTPNAASGAFSGNVTNASTAVTTKNVAVSGNALDTQPTTQSTIGFGTVTGTSIVVNLSGGDGEKRIVVARLGSAVSFSPTDANAITGTNSDFSSATDQGSGNKVVYDGSGSSVTVTGLNAGGTYHFAVYEYNEGTGTSQNYLTNSPGTNSQQTSLGITLLDSFGDDEFTSNPVWSGDTGVWTVVANSDAAAGATGSKTLRLSAAGAGTSHLRTQISSWRTGQEWGFWLGRRGQAYTSSNRVFIWLYANEADLESATVDGYRLAIGDDAGGDDIVLEYIVNGAVSATILTSSGSVATGVTDVGFLVRVTRSDAGLWALYTSTLPTSNGTGAIATDYPTSGNTSVSQGSATNNTLVPASNGYFGITVIHTSGASALASTELDNIYFTPTGTVITTSTNTISSFGNVALGTPASSSNYTVSGESLTEDVTVTAPTHFEVSTNNADFSASVVLTQSGGTLTGQPVTVYTRLNPASAVGAVSGNITHTSTGAATVNVAVSGNTLDTEPTTSSSVSFGTVNPTSMVVNFTGGNGEKRIVVIRSGSAVDFVPSDAAAVTGVNADFNTATDQGSGNKIVYDGSGTTVTVTSLSPATTYHFAVYEYNEGTGTSQNYKTSAPGTNNQATSGEEVSTNSDLIVSGSFEWLSNIAYASYQATDITSENSVEVGEFIIRDGGASANDADGQGTDLTAISFTVTNPSLFRKLALYDGTTEISEVSVEGTTVFSSLTGLEAADNGTKTFAVRATFAATVTDNTQFSLTVASVTSNPEKSGFAAANGGGAVTSTTGDNNRVEVTATVLAFVQQPSNVTQGVAMSPAVTVSANDGLGNRDLDFGSNVTMSTSGTFDGSATTVVAASSGLSTFSNLVFSAIGTGVTISGAADGLTGTGNSSTFNVVEGPSTLAAGDIAFIMYQFDTPDKFSFILLRDIGGSTTITFTDNAWTGSALSASEQTGTWTGPASGLTKGTVITIEGTTVTGGGTMSVGLTGLATGGDQILAYQGSSSSPTFIAAISSNTWITTGTTTSNNSYLPTGLTNSVNSLDFDSHEDNGYYTGTLTGTKSELLGQINDDSKWSRSGSLQTHPVWYASTAPSVSSNGNASSTTVGGSTKVGSILWSSVTTGGTVTVTYYGNRPENVSGISESGISSYRWHFQNSGVVFSSARLAFAVSQLNGITEDDATIKLYKRPSLGSGAFTLVGTLTYVNSGTPGDQSDDSLVISGITSFSEFTMADDDSPLPVELTSFSAAANRGGVILNWSTATEVNSYGFEIQRKSLQTQRWENVGFAAGAGNSNSRKTYRFVDGNVATGTYVYRLKQLDNDGQFDYSNEILVDVTAPQEFSLSQNYPNPFNPSTMVSVTIPESGNVRLAVYNALGALVTEVVNKYYDAGSYSFEIDAAGIESGVYFYRLESGSFAAVKKMVVLK